MNFVYIISSLYCSYICDEFDEDMIRQDETLSGEKLSFLRDKDFSD